jgi:hypothetical protein
MIDFRWLLIDGSRVLQYRELVCRFDDEGNPNASLSPVWGDWVTIREEFA